MGSDSQGPPFLWLFPYVMVPWDLLFSSPARKLPYTYCDYICNLGSLSEERKESNGRFTSPFWSCSSCDHRGKFSSHKDLCDCRCPLLCCCCFHPPRNGITLGMDIRKERKEGAWRIPPLRLLLICIHCPSRRGATLSELRGQQSKEINGDAHHQFRGTSNSGLLPQSVCCHLFFNVLK